MIRLEFPNRLLHFIILIKAFSYGKRALILDKYKAYSKTIDKFFKWGKKKDKMVTYIEDIYPLASSSFGFFFFPHGPIKPCPA